ncbi:MAG TPA: uroporphyrinogen-III C-methyltransferase [Halomonas sp.]|uniref:uroporphyrinogen-III C-methyltransferase n=1 Tax=Vreelandella aquamarina TaxID=77097 RepID=A0A1H8J3P4_9GAMM|nr:MULTISPECIES: uroporphyrinogen-III C-methyltransferase [Halomonas]KJD19694.1 CysG [Halomonas meridiana]SEN74578.1 uroporphyrinogen-III C-methyltransferase [Halomonas aquamarina]HAY17067.1 uroporphyrinogen-III C-methyltransferase [Halomonas sp.]HBM42247.1 uroporphyrinogen-III C-methyltransferase [Halomonas sp.]
MRALSKQLTQKWPEALWRLGQRAWAPFSRDTATRLRLPLSGECHPGTVYLVGAGSGDVELLTLKAARLLMQADAVVYDRLVGGEVLGLIPPGTERYYVGKASGHHSMPQAEIGALIVSLAQSGKSVVRLKGGDPGVFGRMGEELAALAEAELPAEIVPGITAASAAAAGMGIPLTDRGHAQQVRFITAQLCREGGMPDWASLARQDETLVFYMGLSKVAAICHGLRQAGLPDTWPIMLVANASQPEQQSLVGTLADMPERLAAQPLPSPCLIMVGSVVSMVAHSPAARLSQTQCWQQH